jgi:hypothetical protein
LCGINVRKGLTASTRLPSDVQVEFNLELAMRKQNNAQALTSGKAVVIALMKLPVIVIDD